MRFLPFLPLMLSVTAVKAQSPCTDLDILSVRYSPFSDSSVIVEVANSGSEIFSYPGFVLIHSNGDTLALETVNYFGIGEQSVHQLAVRPGIMAPTEMFQGQLQLHTGFFNELACTWPLNEVLCLTDDCADMVIGFENWGGALVLGDFTFSITDSTGAEVDAGAFTMTAEEQYWQHSVCLSIGNYTYQVTTLGGPTGGGPTMTVSSSPWFGSIGISRPFPWHEASTFELEVPFYLHCMESGILNVRDAESARPTVTVMYDGSQTMLSHPMGIASVTLFAMDGRQIGSWQVLRNVFALPVGLAPGLYVAKVTLSDSRTETKTIGLIPSHGR